MIRTQIVQLQYLQAPGASQAPKQTWKSSRKGGRSLTSVVLLLLLLLLLHVVLLPFQKLISVSGFLFDKYVRIIQCCDAGKARR